MTRIAHIAIHDDWVAARRLGEYEVSTRGVPLADAGFIQAVALDRVGEVLRGYDDSRFAVLIVVLEPGELETAGVTVRASGDPGSFHIDGALPTETAAVVAVVPVDRRDGALVPPDLSSFA